MTEEESSQILCGCPHFIRLEEELYHMNRYSDNCGNCVHYDSEPGAHCTIEQEVLCSTK